MKNTIKKIEAIKLITQGLEKYDESDRNSRPSVLGRVIVFISAVILLIFGKIRTIFNPKKITKAEILEKYKGQKLGAFTYKNKKEVTTEKLKDKDWMIHCMYEWSCHDFDYTEKGKEFLREYWGLDEIADILFKKEAGNGDFTISYKSKENLAQGLEKLQTIE